MKSEGKIAEKHMRTIHKLSAFLGCVIVLLLINWWYHQPVSYENIIVLQDANHPEITEQAGLELQLHRHWFSPTVVEGKMDWKGKDYISEAGATEFQIDEPLKWKIEGRCFICPFQEDTPDRVFYIDDPEAMHAWISFHYGELESLTLVEDSTVWIYNNN